MRRPGPAFVLAALLLSLAACSPSKTVKTYDLRGLRFSYLPGWMVTTDLLIRRGVNVNVREVTVNGPEHSLLLLFCFPEAADVNLETFAAHAAKSRDGVVRAQAGGAPYIARAVTAKIAGREAAGIEQSFDLVLLGQILPHRATYYLVHVPGFKVVVVTQAAQRHLASVRPAWQKVFDTLSLEPPPETPGNRSGPKAIFVQ
jgi:hypothetical protein